MLFEAKAKQFDTSMPDFGSHVGSHVDSPAHRPAPRPHAQPLSIGIVAGRAIAPAPARPSSQPLGITPTRLRRLQTDFRDAFDLVSGTLPGLFRDRWVSWFYDADSACFQVLDRSGEPILEARLMRGIQWEARLNGRTPLIVRDRSVFGVFRKLGLLPP